MKKEELIYRNLTNAKNILQQTAKEIEESFEESLKKDGEICRPYYEEMLKNISESITKINSTAKFFEFGSEE